MVPGPLAKLLDWLWKMNVLNIVGTHAYIDDHSGMVCVHVHPCVSSMHRSEFSWQEEYVLPWYLHVHMGEHLVIYE